MVGRQTNEIKSLKQMFKEACGYRDVLEKQSTNMTKCIHNMTKERHMLKQRHNIVERHIDELNQLMSDVNGDRYSSPQMSNRK